MKILGMPFWPKTYSDEQYVERVRKGLLTMRRWRYLMAAIGVCLLAILIWLSIRAVNFLSDLNNITRVTGHDAPTVHEQAIYAVYFVAIGTGFLIGFFYFNAIFHIGSAFFEYRKDKLLVECWDALSDAEKARLRQKSN